MNPNEMSLLITGSSRGIGKSLCEIFLSRGWNVFGCSRGASDLDHPSYTHFSLDVSDEKSIVRMFSKIRQSGKQLYALLANAGVASMNHALTTPKTTMDHVLDVNVVGTMLCCREAGKLMLPHRQGRIITFGSVAVEYNLEGEAAYTASKAAVEAYTRVLARELGEFGITVNAISPNPIKTDLIAGVSEEKMLHLVNRQSIKRFGTIDDVLYTLDYFMNPGSAFITGQVIYFGGP